MAIISPCKEKMQWALEHVRHLSEIVGLHTNSKKTQIYRWSPPPRRPDREKQQTSSLDVLDRQGDTIPLQAPIFHYLRHLLAPPAWEQKARDNYMGTVCAYLAYRTLPLNAFERV